MTVAKHHTWSAYGIVVAATAAALAVAAHGYGWRNLLLTPDQRGRVLMHEGKPQDASAAFHDPLWRGVALFRAGDFKTAAQVLGGIDTAEGAYNQASALVMLGQYDDATKRYDRALELRPNWPDAIANREIARIRAERVRAQGGETGNTDSTPDQVVFDKSKKGGEDTTVQGEATPMSDEAVRALWLKRVQTRPADFLRVKFAYQLQNNQNASGAPP